MGMTSPFPEPDSPQLERFMLRSRAEIAAILRRLRESRVPLTAYFDTASALGVTRLLAEDGDGLVFEGLRCTDAQRQLLAASTLTFVGFADGIKLQFTSAAPRAVHGQSGRAFVVPMPAAVVRLQRRESARLQPPRSKPAVCRVPLADGSGRYEALRVLDVSAAGLAVLAYPERVALMPGEIVEGCRLDLPGIGGLEAVLHVRHVDPIPADDGARCCGCSFVEMAPAAHALLVRYVDRLGGEITSDDRTRPPAGDHP